MIFINCSSGNGRIAKKINGAITEKYLWQGLTRLLAVYDGSDNLLMRFEYADSRMPVATIKTGVRYSLAYDQVGSLRLVVDYLGNVVKDITYDSFGNIISDSDPSYEIAFGFAGGLQDKNTGLVRFGYRDYDPNIGQWTAKDPIFFSGGDTNLYGYVLNDPVNNFDPLGLELYGAPNRYFYGVSQVIMQSIEQGFNNVTDAINTVYAFATDFGNMAIDQAAQKTAEDLTSRYISPATGAILKKLNFAFSVFDPFPPAAEAPTLPSKENDTICR